MSESALVIPHPSQQPATLTSNAAKIHEIKSQVNLIQHVMKEVMREGEHFGIIPGCGDKPALLKPGAEKLMLTFRLANDLEVVTVDLAGLHREYRVKVTIYAPSGQRLGTGVGSCSTMESKYRFRTGPVEDTKRQVPREYWNCRESDPAKAQDLIGGKGYSVKKLEGTWKIVRQGQKMEVDNPCDHYNTCLKMAKKRALVDAVLTSTAASDIFTQDIDENPDLFGDAAVGEENRHEAQVGQGGNNAAPSPDSVKQDVEGEGKSVTRDEILKVLIARNIRHENAGDGTISAFPEYSDTSARNWLKAQGFNWFPDRKSWTRLPA
jgi:hypothetical protein